MLRIVIPTYNRAIRVSTLVDHLLGFNSHFQLIVVDDHSNDQNVDELAKLSGKYFNDNRLKIIFSDVNTGGAGARIIGAEFEGNYDFIWFLDDDDTPTSNGFDEFNLYLDQCGEDFIVLSSIYKEKVMSPSLDQLYQRLRRFGQDFNTSCCIISKELYFKSGGWDKNLVSGQDTDLFLRLANISIAVHSELLKIIVVEHDSERITTNWKKQMIGKFQFICKNYRVLHPLRLLRYIVTFVLFVPYGKSLIARFDNKK